MNATGYIFDSMVHDLMSIMTCQPLLGEKEGSVQRRSRLNMGFRGKTDGFYGRERTNGLSQGEPSLVGKRNRMVEGFNRF